jgi:hypothetical protein
MASDLLAYTKHNPVSYLIHYVNDYLNYHRVGEVRNYVRHAVNCYHQGIKVEKTTLPPLGSDVVVVPFFNPWEQDYVDELVSQKNVEKRKEEILKRREVALRREANKKLLKLQQHQESEEPSNDNQKDNYEVTIADYFMDIFGLQRTHLTQTVDTE